MLSTPLQPEANSSPASLGDIPVEHWWRASGSVPAQPGCPIQAGQGGYTAAGRHSAAPRAGAEASRPQESECNLKLFIARSDDCPRPLSPLITPKSPF